MLTNTYVGTSVKLTNLNLTNFINYKMFNLDKKHTSFFKINKIESYLIPKQSILNWINVLTKITNKQLR